MRKAITFHIIGGLLMVLALTVFVASVNAALSTATDATVQTTTDGHQTVYWQFTGSATGTDTVHVPAQLHGLIDAAYFVSDATDVINNTATITVSVKEIISVGGTDTLIDGTDIAGGHCTTSGPPKAVHLWPTYTIPVSSEVQLELSGAKTIAGAPAKGTFVMTLTPYAAK